MPNSSNWQPGRSRVRSTITTRGWSRCSTASRRSKRSSPIRASSISTCAPRPASTGLEGAGQAEAPRGVLHHHYKVDDNGKITWANLVIATGQNNNAMNRGVLQAARSYVKDGKFTEGILNRVEAVVRTFDPCLSCSTHAFGQMPLEISLRVSRRRSRGSRRAGLEIIAHKHCSGTISQRRIERIRLRRTEKMTITARCLILACGNTLRSDDGVGPTLAAWAEERFREQPNVRVISRQQWTPDLAAETSPPPTPFSLSMRRRVPRRDACGSSLFHRALDGSAPASHHLKPSTSFWASPARSMAPSNPTPCC